MHMTIYTYGGGEVLKNIFNAIAMLTGKGEVVQSLIIIAISCGTLWAVVKAFFSNQVEAILTSFFLPMLAITGLLMIPTTTVHIEDAFTKKPITVDHVPWLVANVSEWIGSIGYNVTDKIESVMHSPNDIRYNATGMIFGSDTAMDVSKYKITNPILAQHLKRFAKQCVLFDIGLKKYNLQELSNTNDLWNFLEQNSSPLRMIPYTDPLDKSKKTVLINCQEAVRKLTPLFKEQKDYYAKQEISKHLPLTFQVLSGIKKEKEELIGQQIMMNYLSGELDSANLAKTRAYTQQKNTFALLGSLASQSLVTMRVVIEALIYASVIFIIPLSMLPGGFSFLSTWLWLALWIQLWPPFYAITNYIMQSVALGRASGLITSADQGLNMFTSYGLTNLNEDIFLMSSYLAVLVPFLSYAVIKGGISSFMHMIGSLTSPAQSAAGAAASEQSTGNYSFANTSFGQMSYDNTSAYQHNTAPSHSSGYFTHNQGNMSEVYASDEAIIDHKGSNLRWSVSSDSAVTESFQKAQQNSEAFTESQQKNYTESLAAQGRSMWDLSSHLSQSQNYSEGISGREALDVQESARYLKNQASSMAQQYGISEHESMSLLLGGNIPLIGGGSFSRNATTDEVANHAHNISNSEDFQRNVQTVSDFAKQHAHSALGDEGVRLADGTSRSIDETKSAQEQYMIAKNHTEQVSATASWAQQNTNFVRKALNQDLVNWATDKLGYEEAKRVLTNGNDNERAGLISDFVSSLHSISEPHYADPQRYESAPIKTIDIETEKNNLYSSSRSAALSSGLQRGSIEEKAQQLEANHFHAEEAFGSHIKETDHRLHRNEKENSIGDYLDDKAHNAKYKELMDEASLSNSGKKAFGFSRRLYNGPINQVKIAGQYDESQPLGWNK